MLIVNKNKQAEFVKLRKYKSKFIFLMLLPYILLVLSAQFHTHTYVHDYGHEHEEKDNHDHCVICEWIHINVSNPQSAFVLTVIPVITPLIKIFPVTNHEDPFILESSRSPPQA